MTWWVRPLAAAGPTAPRGRKTSATECYADGRPSVARRTTRPRAIRALAVMRQWFADDRAPVRRSGKLAAVLSSRTSLWRRICAWQPPPKGILVLVKGLVGRRLPSTARSALHHNRAMWKPRMQRVGDDYTTGSYRDGVLMILIILTAVASIWLAYGWALGQLGAPIPREPPGVARAPSRLRPRPGAPAPGAGPGTRRCRVCPSPADSSMVGASGGRTSRVSSRIGTRGGSWTNSGADSRVTGDPGG